MFNTKFLKTLNKSFDSSLYVTYMFLYMHNAYKPIQATSSPEQFKKKIALALHDFAGNLYWI